MLLDFPTDENMQPSFAAIFVQGLTNPALPTPAGVVGPRGKAAIKRYNVYRNNVTVSLINALAATYPAVHRITGVEFFRAMARFHSRHAANITSAVRVRQGLPGLYRDI
jgi:hypothetical protein